MFVIHIARSIIQYINNNTMYTKTRNYLVISGDCMSYHIVHVSIYRTELMHCILYETIVQHEHVTDELLTK